MLGWLGFLFSVQIQQAAGMIFLWLFPVFVPFFIFLVTSLVFFERTVNVIGGFYAS